MMMGGYKQIMVFAVRGTYELMDVFQDLDIWCEALVIQVK